MRKSTCCIIPTIWHSGEGEVMETVKRSVLSGVREEGWTGEAQKTFRAAKLFCMVLSYCINFSFFWDILISILTCSKTSIWKNSQKRNLPPMTQYSHLATASKLCSPSHANFLKVVHLYSAHFLFFKRLFFWERQRQREWGRGREGGRERESQAGFVLPAQGLTSAQGLNSQNCEIMTWAETKSQTLNRLSHPGAPMVPTFLFSPPPCSHC